MSADPPEKAKIFAKELNLKSKIGYGLGIEEMRKLGLYVSEPRANEVDYIFLEPGIFDKPERQTAYNWNIQHPCY